jgi:PIN domain nuclease of toxin-antitoxin system
VNAILLDTHVLVWLFDGSDRISTHVLSLIREACAEDRVYISAITPWEIAMLSAKSRITLKREISEWMDEVFDNYGISLAPLLPEISIDSTRLPQPVHGDPSDRIIIATARHLNAVLLTADKAILHYAAQGHLKAMKAD